LGLGDRHLDNILMHKRDGQLIHIDFNVIFGRGARLKVPEVVPFRLTHTMAAALGPAGKGLGLGLGLLVGLPPYVCLCANELTLCLCRLGASARVENAAGSSAP
jgi:hypothetical protein